MRLNKYNDLSEDEQERAAEGLMHSMRGAYIIGQALRLAVTEIESRPKIRQEPSDVADMILLGEQIFSIGWMATAISQGDIPTQGKEEQDGH